MTQPRLGPIAQLTAGRVWRYGDGVNTDAIFPGKYTYTLREPGEIAAHALEDLDPAFVEQARPGDIVVAGRNWGHGSSREQAVTCLKYKGVAAIVARSFARIYFRNGINQGLLLLTCPEAVEAARSGDRMAIDLERCLIHLEGREIRFPPLSPSIYSILQAGGLVPHLRERLRLGGAAPTGLDA